ncbi:MAG: DUF1844 domain-containing protein [bacterium]
MSDSDQINDFMFSQLVISLQMGAMQQMGKIASPITGKVERDLQMAKASIDMLSMLEAKTKGNLSDEESKLLKHVLYELRMNFVDESNKKDDKVDKPETTDKIKTDTKTDTKEE